MRINLCYSKLKGSVREQWKGVYAKPETLLGQNAANVFLYITSV